MHRSIVLAFLALLLASCVGTASAGGRNRVENRALRWIDAHEAEQVAFLKRVVDANSGTMNTEGVRAVGEVYREAFEALGMETEWVELPEGMNRAGHLIARTPGKPGKKRILLIGHLDTVFEQGSSFQRFERDGHMAAGPGVIDMKGGNTVILYALRALHAAGGLDDVAVTVVFTGDEEKPGAPLATTRAPLLEAARESHVALGFEALVDHMDTATIARRGFVGWTLEVDAQGGHSSLIFSEEHGHGAIYEAARILSAFRGAFEAEENLTVSVGRVLGGTEVEDEAEKDGGTVVGKRNVIPVAAVAAGDIRALTPEQLARTRTRMQEILAASLPRTRARIAFDEGYPPMAPTDENQALLEALSAINQDLGRGAIEAVHPMRRGAADISFVAPLMPSMDGLGPLGTGDHSEDEVIDLRSLPLVTKRAALLIHRLGSEVVTPGAAR